MRKLIVTLFLLFFIIGLVVSQPLPVYSQYVMNEFIINPAVAGSDGMTSLNFSGRKQWVGFSSTPETYSASVSTRILKSPFSIKQGKLLKGSSGRVGLGASFISDRNGAVNRTLFMATYAYHLFINNAQLSFGLTSITTQFRIDSELAPLKSPSGDPVAGLLGKSAYIPDMGSGISLSTNHFHVGLSVMQLFQSPIKFGEVRVNAKELQHIRKYSLYSYYNKQLANEDWQIEPSVFIRGDEHLQFGADFSSRLIYQHSYWAGLSFRTSGEFILLLGLKMNRVYFGYSFDYGFNQISRLTYGSHEVVLALKLGDSTRRYRWHERY